MLDLTLKTSFIPGTNVPRNAAGGNWTYLLPSLELRHVLCLGLPPSATLRTLSQLGQKVVVACRHRRGLWKAEKAARTCGLQNVRPVSAGRLSNLPVPSHTVDLVLIVDGGARRLRGHSSLWAELHRVLTPDGLIYFEPGLWADRLYAGKALCRLTADFGAAETFRLTPTFSKEMHTAVPAGELEMMGYFSVHGLDVPSTGNRIMERTQRMIGAYPLLGWLGRRRGVLLGTAAADVAQRPPRYLCDMARQANVDIEHHRWGMLAPGKYPSRKVLFFLFDRAGKSPQYLVKLTRASELNYRLENEYRALRLLADMGFDDADTVPQPAFFGHHGGLAIVGETAIDGVPFDRRTTLRADCPAARAVVDRLTELGAATATPGAVTGRQVAEGLQTLQRRFVEIYRLTVQQRRLLDAQIARLAESRQAMPLVFQHGDPGLWNVLMTHHGQAALLDWEAAEPQGMPLWDLLYFLRSYAVRMARTQGVRDRLKGFSQYFLAESSSGPMIVRAIRHYCGLVDLPPDLIEPLFYTCWMHRALKEATRLGKSRLQRGHYVELFRWSADHHNSPPLQRLLSVAPKGTATAPARPSAPDRLSTQELLKL